MTDEPKREPMTYQSNDPLYFRERSVFGYRCTTPPQDVAEYDPCGECPKGECDDCKMCRYFRERATR